MKTNEDPHIRATPVSRPHSIGRKASRFVPTEVVGRDDRALEGVSDIRERLGACEAVSARRVRLRWPCSVQVDRVNRQGVV